MDARRDAPGSGLFFDSALVPGPHVRDSIRTSTTEWPARPQCRCWERSHLMPRADGRMGQLLLLHHLLFPSPLTKESRSVRGSATSKVSYRDFVAYNLPFLWLNFQRRILMNAPGLPLLSLSLSFSLSLFCFPRSLLSLDLPGACIVPPGFWEGTPVAGEETRAEISRREQCAKAHNGKLIRRPAAADGFEYGERTAKR